MASKGKPYRTVIVGDFEVLIGRGSDENDALTFHVAEPHDTWLHVGGGTPGSHVVLRNPEKKPIPRDVLETVAAYTAHYSKARGAAKVEVDYCLASQVKKPRGAPAGLVELASWKTLRVAPKAPPGND